MPLKALRVTMVEFSPSGGLFQFAFQLGWALAGRGHQVELVTGPDPELTSEQPGFEVLPILPTWHPGAGVESVTYRKARRIFRGARYVAAWAVLARHLRAVHPDVVQWGEWHFAIDGLFAAAVISRRWSPVAVDLAHSPIPLEEQRQADSPYRRGPILEWGLRRGYQAVDSVLVLGEASRRDLLSAWPGVARCDVIPHGDEQALAGATDPPPPSACGPTAVCFGSLTRYKGIDVLLDAWPSVRRRIPDATLRIAGPVVGDLDVADLARRAATAGGVDLRPGYVPVSEVPDIVGTARVAVAPYRRSNASGAVRLAQTLSRPVVVTDVGDLADSVVDAYSGLVVEPGQPEPLADAVSRLLESPALADAFGAAGRQQLAAEASWPIVAERVERVYSDLLP